MIGQRNFVRPRKARLGGAWAPARFGGNGALFRGRRNFWHVADDKSETETLGLRVPAPQMSSTMFGTPFRSGIWSGDGRLTLFVQGPYSWSGGVMATPTFCRS